MYVNLEIFFLFMKCFLYTITASPLFEVNA